MAEEARDPGHEVPKAVNLVRARRARRLRRHLGRRAVGAAGRPPRRRLQPELNETSTRATPRRSGLFENDPVLGIISRLGLHGTVLKLAQYYVGMLAATILFIATNAGMIGISRLSWSLAEHRQLPSLFSQLHPKFRTPWFTLVFFSILAGAADHPRRNRRARQPLLVRRDAVVHDRPRRGHRAARSRTPTASAPTHALERAHPRRRDPDDRGARRDRHVRRVVSRSSPCTPRPGTIGIPWMIVGMAGYFLYRQPPGPRSRRGLPHRAPRAPGGLRGARVPHGARADLRRRRQRRRRCAAPPS